MFGWLIGLVLMLLLAGCQADSVLPTLVLTSTPPPGTPTRRPLPATWTPSPAPPVGATPAPQTLALTPTAAVEETGTLYYIFNGDAIVKLIDDGSFEELIPIPHIGMGISDLALSPDDRFLAYVGPGDGAAREIYVTDREGSQTRPLTDLGFARISSPTWRPDGGALAFLAAPDDISPLEIYVVSADGSGQRPLTRRGSANLRDLVWSPDGKRLFFSDLSIHAFTLETGAVSISLTTYAGFGPDYSLSHHPSQPLLYYIKPFRALGSAAVEDSITHIDTAKIDAAPQEVRSEQKLAPIGLRFARDGRYLLIASSSAVWVQDMAFGTAIQTHQGGRTLPLPALSPDNERVAFVDLDANGVAQIFTVARQGGERRQITNHQEGTISPLVWASGS